ncbi:MAG: hypothetical protein ACI9U0_000170 [Flavobacteriales bacterium]|jgi:uncharacterized protein (TIGR02145 family)|tara:strand:+ start:6482 stop:7249 length:768 start_codon:yes stop_codon:yes gene_type:complete
MKNNIILIFFAVSLSSIGQNMTLNQKSGLMKKGVVKNKESVNSSSVDTLVLNRKTLITSNKITDGDGNIYTSVKIGTQEWTSENLITTKYADGTPIPNVTDSSKWGNLTTGAWSFYNNNSQNDSTYGKLYNWHAASDLRNVCPTGWHVPTDAEWTVLNDYLAVNGHSGMEGTTLKSTSGWSRNNGTDDYGWFGLPGGYRNNDGVFYFIANVGSWWSSSEGKTNNSWYRLLNYNNDKVYRNSFSMRNGFSVRCLRN